MQEQVFPDAGRRLPAHKTDTVRVLHVHAGNIYGGVETMLLTQVRSRSLCPDLENVFALSFGGRFSEESSAGEASVHWLGPVRIREPLSIHRARRKLRDLLRRESFDVVLTHSCWSQAIFGETVRAEGMPLGFYLHAPVNGRHWLERWARRSLPNFALCNSHFTAATLPQFYPNVPFEIVYCPVSAPEASYSELDVKHTRSQLQTPANATVVIQVGRLEKLKGHGLHLEALSLLKDLPDWVCWQVGGAQLPQEHKYLEELKRRATTLGIADRMRFIDQQSDVRRLMAAADIYCQPNTSPDSFGITFVEALHAQLPVVTTSIGGALEIIDESCGLLVRPNDARAVAKALKLLIQDRSLRRKLGAAGPNRARSLCDVGSQMLRYKNCFLRVLNDRDKKPGENPHTA